MQNRFAGGSPPKREVVSRARDEYVFTAQADVLHGPAQKFTGPADERPPDLRFFLPRGLAHEQHGSIRVPFSGDRHAGSAFSAQRASGDLGGNLRKRFFPVHERDALQPSGPTLFRIS